MHELEVVELEAIQRHVRLLDHFQIENPVIFDIGANSGAVSEAYLQLLPQAKIYAFEPNPDLLNSLHERLGTRVFVSPIALGEKNQSSNLNVFNDDTVSSFFDVDPRLSAISNNFDLQQSVPVDIQTLDFWISSHPEISQVNILKIDTQGYDLRVLKGAKVLLNNEPPQLIQIEMTIATTYQGQAEFPEIWSYLGEFGYKLFDFDRLVHTKKGNLYWGDALFISSDSWARIGLL